MRETRDNSVFDAVKFDFNTLWKIDQPKHDYLSDFPSVSKNFVNK